MAGEIEQRLLTAEALYGLPDDGRCYELVNGWLISEPLPGFSHGEVVLLIGSLLRHHVASMRLGKVVVGDTGFILARSPDTVRGPDVAFVRTDRVPARTEASKFFSGAPDLAVEVLSPGNRPAEMHAKVADYLAAGTRAVWIVDPRARSVTVYRSLFSPTVLSEADDLEGEDVLPGFRVRVSEFFED
jgi:Uma2 family endonuclease